MTDNNLFIEEKEREPPAEEGTEVEASSAEDSVWSHDIENRNYYYDDSTGYEVYRPEDDDEDKDDKPDATES